MKMKYLVPLCSAFALYAIFFFSRKNGLHELGLRSIESGTLPGSYHSLRTVYTGVPVIDKTLTTLTTFFWPAVDGSNPGLMLHTIGFSGTFCAAWVLVTLESWRKGNAGTLAAFPVVFGLACQILTFAFIAPVYASIQLASSVTVSRPDAKNICVPRVVLNAIPLAFIVGYTAPLILLMLPAPDVISVDVKQVFIAIWQPWPAYISILTTMAYFLFSRPTGNDNSIGENRATLRCLRRVYAFAFCNAALTHVATHAVSITSAVAPTMFKETYTKSLHPYKVFGVVLPWIPLQVDSLDAGVQIFLRWGYLIGSTGVLLWAMTLYTNAHRVILASVSYFNLLVKVGMLTILTGPVSAAVELMWERDELVIHETASKSPGLGVIEKSPPSQPL